MIVIRLVFEGITNYVQFLTSELTGAFSTFWKHLFNDKLWRTLFFQPVGAVLKYG